MKFHNRTDINIYNTAAILKGTALLFHLLNGQYEIATLLSLWPHCEVELGNKKLPQMGLGDFPLDTAYLLFSTRFASLTEITGTSMCY